MAISGRSYNRIAAIATAITAVAAIVIAISDNIQTRKHDRLSVIPYLMMQLDLQTEAKPRGLLGSIHLNNEGVGPALIDSVIIILPDSSRHASWQSLRGDLTGRGYTVRGYVDYSGREAVGVGKGVALLTLSADTAHANAMSGFMSGMNVVVKYHSIYGEPFVTDLQGSERN